MKAQEFLDAIEGGRVLYKDYRDEIAAVDSDSELWGELHYERGESRYAVEDVGPIEVLESGGGMDEGSNAYVVFKVGDTYLRKSGYYASHYGYDWDGELEEVVPAQKTITVYNTL